LKTDPNTLLGWMERPNTLDGAGFDLEAYRLSRDLSRLPDRVKKNMRTLIRSILQETIEN
jgi:hypothetical protein